jgi:hypothetical protein
MHRVELTKSLEVRAPHFQKDLIIPQIYDLNNIKLIQSYGYKESPVNKVAELKKQKIQNVIKGIVYKQRAQSAQTKPMYKSLALTKEKKNEGEGAYYAKCLEEMSTQPLFMDIDEQIGEMITLAD